MGTDGFIGLFNTPGNTDDRDEVLAQFNNTSWAKYAMIEDFGNSTHFMDSGSLLIIDNELRLPPGYTANTDYTYVSSGLTLDGGDSVTKATTIFDFSRDNGCHVKFETAFNGSTYYKWFDSSDSTNYLSTEKTSSDFTTGTSIKARITITTPASLGDEATINFFWSVNRSEFIYITNMRNYGTTNSYFNRRK